MKDDRDGGNTFNGSKSVKFNVNVFAECLRSIDEQAATLINRFVEQDILAISLHCISVSFNG